MEVVFVCYIVARSLKAESHRALKHPRAAAFEQRRQSAAGAAGTQREVEHRRGLPEKRAIHILHRVAEIRVVEGIEGIQAKIQAKPIAPAELPPNRRVH